MIPGLRESAVHLDGPSADGFALKGEFLVRKAEQLLQVGKGRVAVDLVFPLVPADQVILHRVVLVPDVPHHHLQHIFHGNDAQGAAVFVHDDRQMLPLLPQGFQHLGQLHRLVDIAGLHQQAPQIRMLVLRQGLQKPVQMQRADYMIDGSFIHGNPGIAGPFDDGEDFLPAVVDVDRDYVHPGRHGLGGGNIRKIDGRLNQLALVFVDDGFILRRVDQGGQLLHLLLRLLLGLFAGEGLQDQVDQPHNRPDGQPEQDHQSTQRVGVLHGDPVGALLGRDLRDRFPEDDDRDGHQGGGQSAVVFVPRQQEGAGGRHGGGRDIHQVVPDQDGPQGVVKPIDNPQGHGGLPVAGFLFVFQPQPVAAGIAHLRPGEKVAQHNAEHDSHDQQKRRHFFSSFSAAFSGSRNMAFRIRLCSIRAT